MLSAGHIQELSRKYIGEVIAFRRHFHQHPELSFAEEKTAAYICSLLNAWGIPYRKGIAGTGITGYIRGTRPGKKIIALRADMDALPVEEKTGLEFASVHRGIMHACGHDAHMAALLGCALILNEIRDHFGGTIQLIFQPGEEKLPGGALRMMEEGLFSEGDPDLIIGQHVDPDLESGRLGFRPGPYMASTDELYFTIRGKGGHAAMPHKTADPVLAAAHTVVALQQITSRRASPLVPTVLSVGKIIAMGATNVIPDEVSMEGTFRTFDETWRHKAHLLIREVAENTAKAHNTECSCTIKNGYPVLVNNPELTQMAIQAAGEYAGTDKITMLDMRMTSEDFAWYSQKYPAVFYRFGTKSPGENSPGLHTAGFTIHEPALQTATGTMTYLALRFLKE